MVAQGTADRHPGVKTEAGWALLRSPYEGFRRIGEEMLAEAAPA